MKSLRAQVSVELDSSSTIIVAVTVSVGVALLLAAYFTVRYLCSGEHSTSRTASPVVEDSSDIIAWNDHEIQ